MGLRQRIVSEVYDEKNNKVVNREIIKDKEIKKPGSIEDLGYNHKEQIDLLQHIQDTFLFTQATITISDICESCGSKTSKAGATPCEFHAVYTDHWVTIPRKQCCNPSCGHRSYATIKSLFGNNVHPDLVEKQLKTGSKNSFMESQKSLEGENGRYRTINNQLKVKRTIDKVGKILTEIHKKASPPKELVPAKELIAQVDGGYIKSNKKGQGNFEVLVSHVHNPKHHHRGSISSTGKRRSGVIEEKIYSASAYKDRGKTIREMTIASAKTLGMTGDTKITALSDGAKNCWTTLKALEKHCASIEYILDWYHINQKFDTLCNRLEDPYSSEVESIKWKIWHGKSEEVIPRLNSLYLELLDSDCADKVHDLLKYISNNKRYLINYADRHESKLPFTSSIIESTIETLVNTRHKKKHKAQWTREGAHNVLQIRSSLASKRWETEWDEVKKEYYKKAA